jgi:hypothetical protein
MYISPRNKNNFYGSSHRLSPLSILSYSQFINRQQTTTNEYFRMQVFKIRVPFFYHHTFVLVKSKYPLQRKVQMT